MPQADTEKALRLLKKRGPLLSAEELAGQGVARVELTRLAREGLIERVTRGVYMFADSAPSEHFTLAAMAMRAPQSVVCLYSALQFHNITTQSPHQIWLAVDNKAHKPTSDWPPLHVVRFTKRALTLGVEVHVIDGISVRITSPARTVVDCFKYSREMEFDVAVEALRDYLQATGDHEALWRAAEIQKITSIMRPYLEVLS